MPWLASLQQDFLYNKLVDSLRVPEHIIEYFDVFVLIVSAIGMLKGLNWARMLYSIWGIILMIIYLVTSPSILVLIPGVILYITMVFFLFRPAANKYFAA